MHLSVIIPTYNRSDVILRSLKTWTKQTMPKDQFEVIVVDNNSTDGADKLIKDFIKDKPNLHYLLEPKKGSTHARHAGAKLAKADILMFCDDDGLFNPECVEEILNVYQQNKDVVAVTGKIALLWDKPAPDWIEPYEFMLGKLDYGDEVKYSKEFYLNGGIFSIKRNVFDELGGFNPDLLGNYLVGDGDTGLVIKLHQNNCLIGYTPHAVMKHLQFVDMQGSEEDLGRRFYNVGISNAYGLFRKNEFKFNFAVLKYIFLSLLFLQKKWIEQKFSRKDFKKVFFSRMQRKGELRFFTNLLKKDIRKVVFNSEDNADLTDK